MQILTPTGYKEASTLSIGDEVCAFDISTGVPIVNTILDIHQVTNSDYLQLNNYQPTLFKYILINDTYSFFQDQSVWVDGNIKHCSELEVGDVIYSDTDTDVTTTSVEVVDGLDYWWRLEVSGDASYIADGVQLHNASRFLITGGGSVVWDASDTSIWSATSGGATGASVPGSSDTVTMDGSSGGGTCTLGYSPTVTSITMGAFTGTFAFSTYSPTMSTMSVTGTGTRTLGMGSGTGTLTGNAATIFSGAVLDNFTITNRSNFVCSYSGSTGSRTINPGATSGGSESNSVGFIFTAGSDNIALGGSTLLHDFLFTSGFSGSLGNTARTIYGDITYSANMTITDGSGVTTMAATSGTKTLTTNGVLCAPHSMGGIGGTFVLGDALTVRSTRGFSVTAGSFSDNGFELSAGVISGTGTSTRSMTNTVPWYVTGNGATVWNFNNMTGLTFSQSSTISLTYSGSTGSRVITNATVANNGIQSANMSLKITAGTDIVVVSSARTCGSIDFTGFAGSWTPATTTYYGSLILNSTMVVNNNGSITLTFTPTSGTHTISSNGNTTFGQGGTAIVINASGATYQFGSDFYSQSSLTLTAGTLNFNNYSATCTVFNSSNSNVRSLSMGSGTLYLTGAGTAFNAATTTNLTFDAGTSTIVMNDASSSSKTFSADGLTLYNLQLSGAGTGTFIIGVSTATNTFNNITVDTPPHTVQIFAGKTINVTTFTANGTPGNLITLQSTTSGTPFTLSKSSGAVDVEYLSIKDSTATGGAIFTAYESTDAGGNTGWIFARGPYVLDGNVAIRDENHIPTWIGVSAFDGITPTIIAINASNGGVKCEDGTSVLPSASISYEQFYRDQNHVPVKGGVSDTDSTIFIPVSVNGMNGAIQVIST